MRIYIFANMGATGDSKVVISRPPGRFPKWEFGTMLVSMLSRAAPRQQGPKIMKLLSYKGSRGSSGGACTSPIVALKGFINIYIYMYVYIGPYSVTIRFHDPVPKGLGRSIDNDSHDTHTWWTPWGRVMQGFGVRRRVQIFTWRRGVQTIFGSYVGPHIINIGYFEVYDGIWRNLSVYERIWGYMKGMRRYMRVMVWGLLSSSLFPSLFPFPFSLLFFLPFSIPFSL